MRSVSKQIINWILSQNEPFTFESMIGALLNVTGDIDFEMDLLFALQVKGKVIKTGDHYCVVPKYVRFS